MHIDFFAPGAPDPLQQQAGDAKLHGALGQSTRSYRAEGRSSGCIAEPDAAHRAISCHDAAMSLCSRRSPPNPTPDEASTRGP